MPLSLLMSPRAPILNHPFVDHQAESAHPTYTDPSDVSYISIATTPTPSSVDLMYIGKRLSRTWIIALSVGIVTTGLALRASAAFPELTGSQLLSFPARCVLSSSITS